MKVFHCDHCDHLAFFENTRCVACAHRLGFLPDIVDMVSLEDGPDGLWRSPTPAAAGRTYRLCRNYVEADICNWAVPAEDPNPLCTSCRLTRVIPDLAVAGTRDAWYRLEVAKRRVIYTLMTLGLPIAPDEVGTPGLAFEFLADAAGGQQPVFTGHSQGVVTVNIAEADDAERERRRHALGEPYRTLLGHLRHEVGHYYWGQLLADPARLASARSLFGDDREDYGAALRRHYEQGPKANWAEEFVSAYASAHPWEDWAETWAHYLHMTDTLEMAAACGVSVRPRRAGEPVLTRVPDPAGPGDAPFDRLITSWHTLTYVLNNLNRGMGLADAYPFVLPSKAIEKLRFVHEAVAAKTGELPAASR